jgi:hypothetical protein
MKKISSKLAIKIASYYLSINEIEDAKFILEYYENLRIKGNIIFNFNDNLCIWLPAGCLTLEF